MKNLLSLLAGFFLLTANHTVFAATDGENAPLHVDGTTTIDAVTAKGLFDQGALFVDVRPDKDWEAGRIPGAVHLDVDKNLTEESLSAEAKKDEVVVLYCNGVKCLRSSRASKEAVSWGFSNIKYFRGGMPDWRSAGYPVE